MEDHTLAGAFASGYSIDGGSPIKAGKSFHNQCNQKGPTDTGAKSGVGKFHNQCDHKGMAD
jgi:hypothetical protein